MSDGPVAPPETLETAGPHATSPAGTGAPRVIVAPDAEALAEEAARLVSESIADAIGARGRADVALTGGSSARALYSRLASPPWRERIDWANVHLWWGDERYVPADHPESNAGLAFGTLLALAARATATGEGAVSSDVLAGDTPGVTMPAHQVHPFPVNEAIGRGPDGAAWAAEQYAADLRRELPEGADGLPAFDVVLLGVGPDGHILSAFPGGGALESDTPLVLAVPAPAHVEPHVPRLTLNPRLLAAATRVLVVVPGASKAEIVGQVLAGTWDPVRWPAQLARRSNAIWLLDEAAAANVPGQRRPRRGEEPTAS